MATRRASSGRSTKCCRLSCHIFHNITTDWKGRYFDLVFSSLFLDYLSGKIPLALAKWTHKQSFNWPCMHYELNYNDLCSFWTRSNLHARFFFFFCNSHVVVRKPACLFGHPRQVQLVATCKSIWQGFEAFTGCLLLYPLIEIHMGGK